MNYSTATEVATLATAILGYPTQVRRYGTDSYGIVVPRMKRHGGSIPLQHSVHWIAMLNTSRNIPYIHERLEAALRKGGLLRKYSEFPPVEKEALVEQRTTHLGVGRKWMG